MVSDSPIVLSNLEDKVFLVTGGASGIGAGLVRLLLSENAMHVAFLDIAEKEGLSLEKELNIFFGALKTKFIKCDVANEVQLAAAYNQVLDKYSRLDGVINNAAVISSDERSHRTLIDINLTATVNSTIKALDIMRVDNGGSGGTIVNISSLLALKFNSHLPVYSATKAAVLQFSNCIGMEPNFTATEVRVITVCLGPTDTALLHRHTVHHYDKDCEPCVLSRTAEKQRVESAASGIIEVLKKGHSGSTWKVANDKPAEDITLNINKGRALMCRSVDKPIL